ncbi:MAG: flavin reductase family protein [Sphingomicrobium sp.]
MADPPITSEYRTGSDPRTLRDALGCFATGVTVVTCFDEGGCPFGITANSFTSVSLDPPLLLVNVHKSAASAPALTAASHFAVNVLQTGQQPASIRFSTRDQDRFGPNDWSLGEFGAPVLGDSLSVFECERHAVHDGGDHHIVIGHVLKASFDPSLDPLLYFRGSYRRLHFD